jgi:ubiquinone/menaquinone biosynthesis C-methylase UbiE
MNKRDWEKIYKEKGDLRFAVLPKIRRAAGIFKEKGYKEILDLGCGTGKHSIFLAKRGFSVYAIDISPAGIEIAKKKSESQGLNIHFKHHDMKSIPFSGNFFNAVICTWTIYHGTLKSIKQTISEVHRVLKPDGMFITDFLSVADSTFGIGREIETNTFVGEKGDEKDVPHHYATREELAQLLSEFSQVKIRASRASSNLYTDDEGKSYLRKYYHVEAIR